MANTKRRKQPTAGAPVRSAAAEQPLTVPATAPEPDLSSANATSTSASIASSTAPALDTPDQRHQASPDTTPSPSPAAERAAFMRRRGLAFGGVALLIIAAGALLYSRLAAQPTAAPAPILPAATSIASTATPPVPTAVPAIGANPTATPQAAIAAPPSGTACNPIAGLPVFAGATCTDQDSDSDDGVLKLKNTYMATATADEVRRFYEGTFAQNGWSLGKFKYDINSGQRRVQIEVETEQAPTGTITTVQLTEHGATVAANTTCAPVAGLPALPNATCIKFDTDQDDGVLKTKNTYSTTASPESVWRFYESALTQNGWAGQEFQYAVLQGASQLEVKIEAQPASNTTTEFRIAQK